MEASLPKIIVLLGPTACGKTALSLELAEKLGCEIISADSMQVYRRMDIGSAKLPFASRRGIIHHMLDVVEPDADFSVADFHALADDIIADIFSRDKLPLICGGTGLYINSLVYPYNFSDAADSDPDIRQRLQTEFAENGGVYLHDRLAECDPVAAAKIHPNDSRRLVRALEVFEVTGSPISDMQQHNEPVKYDPVMIGLTAPRELLYRRIEQRVDEMMDEGLLCEVENLLAEGLDRNAVSMQGLGYKQLAAYFAGEVKLDEAVDLIKRDTRRFAKRQFTWFKRDERIKWFSIDQYPTEGELINAVLPWVSQRLEV